jgi:DNA-binding CsgD family transcriptional regulator
MDANGNSMGFDADMTIGGPQENGSTTRAHSRPGPLSRREREVFELLADGLSGAEIAERLVLSPETVRTHIRNGMAKLGASTRSQAVAIALHRREIGDPEHAAAPRPTAQATQAPAPALRELPAEPALINNALESVLDGLVELWDVDTGAIFLTEEDGLTLRRAAYRGASESRPAPPESLALGEGALGRVALERRSQIVADATSGGGGGMIVAPMLGGGRLVGVLGLSTRPSRPIGRRELLLLQAFAGRVAEVVQAGGAAAPARLLSALESFRASWTSATRPV